MMNSEALLKARTTAYAKLAKQDELDVHAWRMSKRLVGGKPIEDRPPLAEIARDMHPFVVIQKSAQIGVTELGIDLALHCAATGYAGRGTAMIVQPTRQLVGALSQGRIDPAIASSPEIAAIVPPPSVGKRGANRVNLKQVGDGFLYVSSAEAKGDLHGIPCDLVIVDELHIMPDGTVELAQKRLNSSTAPRLVLISTPTFAEHGINYWFIRSDQRYYFIPCPACRLEQHLKWTENVDTDRKAIVCRDCREPMDVGVKGQWIATAPGNDTIHGYHLSQLYNPRLDLPALIERSQSPSHFGMQAFFNQDLGEIYLDPSSSYTREVLDRCIVDEEVNWDGQACVMGVDPGAKWFVVIRDDWNRKDGKPQTLRFAGAVDFEQLAGLVTKWNVKRVVIDDAPEHVAATAFARAMRKKGVTVALANYRRRESGHKLHWKQQVRVLDVNRTEYLDLLRVRFEDRSIGLPTGARELGRRVRDGLGDYYRHFLNTSRVIKSDVHGDPAAKWIDAGPDHFVHAELYCMLATEYLPKGGLLNAIRL